MKVKEAIKLIHQYPTRNLYAMDDMFREVQWENAKALYNYYETMFDYEFASGWLTSLNEWGLKRFVAWYYARITIRKLDKWLDQCALEEVLKVNFKDYEYSRNTNT